MSPETVELLRAINASLGAIMLILVLIMLRLTKR